MGRLCRATFLSVWSHQNVYRDQGGKDLGGKGKELSDALVVFGDDIILFSDKRCEFRTTGSVRQAWARWHKAAILESAKQLHGAERWLRSHPERVFCDQACTRRLELSIPAHAQARFHRIAVASGATAACAAHFGSRRGTLMISSDEPLPAFQRTGEPVTDPFVVGDLDPSKGFIHVMDEVSLELVLRELDTARDFVDYLAAREALLRSGKHCIIPGEEDLLAYYIRHRYLGPSRAFGAFEEFDGVALEEGMWDDLTAHSQFRAKKELDRVSYIWDSLIEECAAVRRAGRLVAGSAEKFEEHEAVLRGLASSSRFERRNLAASLRDIVQKAGDRGVRATRLIIPPKDKPTPDHAYVFLALPVTPRLDSAEQYRELRRGLLFAYCQVLGLENRHCPTIIGIATEAGLHGPHSHDFVKLDNTAWTPEREVEARRLQHELKILQPGKLVTERRRAMEFPDPTAITGGKRKRPSLNRPCPCGSTLKYKRCCGKREKLR